MPDLRPFLPSFTAFWLLAQFVLLVILYHAGPWPWASRSLSMFGALLPAWALLLHAGRQGMGTRDVSDMHRVMVGVWATITVLAVWVVMANFMTRIGDPWGAVFAYRAYTWAYVGAQGLLTAAWYIWWRRGGPWPALGGGLLAALGTVISAKVHGARPIADVLEMRPWTYMWAGDHGPIDVLSRVAPRLLTIEVLVLGGASLVLAAFAWRRG